MLVKVLNLPFQAPRSDYRHGHGGDLGVDVNSYQPPAVAPAALHLSQVPESMRTVQIGHEPSVKPLPPVAVNLVYEPEAQTFVPDTQTSCDKPTDTSAESHKTLAQEGQELLTQAVHKAEGILGDVKDMAGTAFGEMKEKASGWLPVFDVPDFSTEIRDFIRYDIECPCADHEKCFGMWVRRSAEEFS